ncbi:hypothetical protein GIB67_023011 [Kingdonia uniflora]|uniref:Calmodulin-binding protein n=1 Tax=Kingdonia uniflora TaxID=39325 RepID=A0A7J7P331_9MAGN|nr:hypothetical protein GIB67_023011 [Kingdonia uniflora]
MGLKRHFGENDGFELRESLVQEPKRQCVTDMSMQEFLSNLEPLIRRVVREEVERGILTCINSSPRVSPDQIEASGSRGWQLHFRNKLPEILFTSSKIEAIECTPLEIVILDASSKQIITTGPLSSIKIEIVVLNGDFDVDEHKDWSEKTFDARMIREREGKRPLLAGNLVIALENGVGYLADITFTDNSSWIRCRKFRLGAKAYRTNKYVGKIREARSGAFIVKDHRGELYKKHYPPSLDDEIWRLEKIGKDGAFHSRLVSNGICTVQDFLRLLVTDPFSLRQILGNGMSNRVWNTIIEHATTCVLDNKRYMHYYSGKQIGLLFNSVYKVIGAMFDGQSCQFLENLTTPQMNFVECMKRHAYKHLHDMVEIDGPPIDAASMSLPIEDTSFSVSNLDIQLPEFTITCQDQPTTQISFNNSNTLPYSLEDQAVSFIQGCASLQKCSPSQRNSFKMKYSFSNPHITEANEWAAGGSLGPALFSGHFTGDMDDISQDQTPNWSPVTATWMQGSRIFFTSDDETNTSFFPSLPDLTFCMGRGCKRNMGWFKLRAAFKWGISVRRDVARKRARLLQLDY